MKFDLMTIINTVSPSYDDDVYSEITDLKKSNKNLNNNFLAKEFVSKITKLYDNIEKLQEVINEYFRNTNNKTYKKIN